MTDITQPKNIIFTGVAGTGKTYELQRIAQQYTENLPVANSDDLLKALLEPLSWRDVICLIFLLNNQQGRKLIKVPEMIDHHFFKMKAQLNDRKENLNQTAWGTLMMYSDKNSVRVKYHRRASQSYFDKDESSNWFLLDDSLSLLDELQSKLDDYNSAISNRFQPKIERFSFVSFHQAYGYEEFVEGIRPKINENGQMTYSVEEGAFLKLCEKAQADPNHRYAMLIDEINRANVSRVFGELMSLIEPSKRAGQASSMSVNLAYSHKPFSVPSNVDIYATMNTQDHSLTQLDMAFRRRFQFIDCPPQPQLLSQISVNGEMIDLAKILTNLNQKISQTLGKDSQLGQSFLMNVNNLAELAIAFEQTIIPQVAQACQNNGQILQFIFGREVVEVIDNKNNFGFMPMQNQGFTVNLHALQEVQTYQRIYE